MPPPGREREVKGSFHPLAARAFEAVFLPFMARRLELHLQTAAVRIDPDIPAVFAANHVSWWDGFLVRALQRRLRPHDPLHTLMLERELRTRPFFRLLGCVGVEPGKAGSFTTALDELSRRRERDPASSYAFFPQGRIWPAQKRPLGFRRGIEPLLARLAPVQLVAVGIRFEPLNTLRPHAFVRCGKTLLVEKDRSVSSREVEALVQGVLDELSRRLDLLGEDARFEEGAA